MSSDDNVLKQDEVRKLVELVYENLANEIREHGITLETFDEIQGHKGLKNEV